MDSVCDRRLWVAILHVSAVFGVLEGVGLLAGYAVVVLPGESSQQVADQPAPAWLLVLGLALCLYGTAVIAVSQYLAVQNGRPILGGDTTSQHPLMRLLPPSGAVASAALAVPLALVSLASSHSRLRYWPLLLAVVALGFSALQRASHRSNEPDDDS